MKVKTLLTEVLPIVVLLIISITTLKGQVPEIVSKSFAEKYPSAQNTDWEKEDEGQFEASFTLDGKKKTAYFLADGSWLSTEAKVEKEHLPQNLITAIFNQFSGYEVEKIKQIETPEWTLAYITELENEDNDTELKVVFNEAGEVLTKEVKEED